MSERWTRSKASYILQAQSFPRSSSSQHTTLVREMEVPVIGMYVLKNKLKKTKNQEAIKYPQS